MLPNADFTPEEVEIIYQLAEDLTGASIEVTARRPVILGNFQKRLADLELKSLEVYLALCDQDEDEFAMMVSMLTIHTTQWFREEKQLELFYNRIKEKLTKNGSFTISIWSAASSTGEEVYSLGILLESLRQQFTNFDYLITASDIDAISVEFAQRAIYNVQALADIPEKWRKFIKKGSGRATGFFTIDKEIRKRCQFDVVSLFEIPNDSTFNHLDAIFCRNVLIYFKPAQVREITKTLCSRLKVGGLLVLGMSEPQVDIPEGTSISFQAAYQRESEQTLKSLPQSLPMNEPAPISPISKPISVLIVDDSKVVRKVLSAQLKGAGMQTDEAENAENATLKVAKHNYDFITLDIHMPGQNGLEWLKMQRQRGLKTPVAMVSDAAPSEVGVMMDALESFAQHYFIKSEINKNPELILESIRQLTKRKAISNQLMHLPTNKTNLLLPLPGLEKKYSRNWYPEVIVIGSSTGGPEALSKLLETLPKPCPPLVIVQHISQNFSEGLAERLSKTSGLELNLVKAGSESLSLPPSSITLIASDQHLCLENKNGRPIAVSKTGEKISSHRPSVDALFNSAADIGLPVVAILLTGMGKDGAQGLLKVQQKSNTFTVTQDEGSCIVYGMPKEARLLGASMAEGNITEIRELILALSERYKRKHIPKAA